MTRSCLSPKALVFLCLREAGRRAGSWQASCGVLPRGTVRKTLTIPLQAVLAPGLAWAILAAELLATTLLVASDRLPGILLRSLQVFLRF